MQTNNYTVYGIHNDTERYVWITYHIITTLSSLVGDTIILLASTRHAAFKLNKFIVTLIQHLAVCDLIVTVFTVIPAAVGLIMERWVWGAHFAYFHEWVVYCTVPATNLLLCGLTTGKYCLLAYPRKTKNWSRRAGHVFCGGIWVLVVTVSAVFVIINRQEIYFDYTTYDTEFRSNDDAWWNALSSFSYSVPTTVVMVTTGLTLRYLVDVRRVSRQVGGSVRWQGLLTVVVTALVYLVATLPYTVFCLVDYFHKSEPPSRSVVQLERISEFLLRINVMSNFYIYSLTVPSFRNFLKRKLKCSSSSVVSSDKFISGTVEDEC